MRAWIQLWLQCSVCNRSLSKISNHSFPARPWLVYAGVLVVCCKHWSTTHPRSPHIAVRPISSGGPPTQNIYKEIHFFLVGGPWRSAKLQYTTGWKNNLAWLIVKESREGQRESGRVLKECEQGRPVCMSYFSASVCLMFGFMAQHFQTVKPDSQTCVYD